MPGTPLLVRGVHQLPITNELLRRTIEGQYGSDLPEDEQEDAAAAAREHLESLYVIEVAGDSLDDTFPWRDITQRNPDLAQENWQVAYDERPLDSPRSCWAFFFHFLDLGKPLETPYGPFSLPALTPLPPHLREIVYETP